MNLFDILKKKNNSVESDSELSLDSELELDRSEIEDDHKVSAFLNSLDELVESDIELNETAVKAKKGSPFETARKIMFCFFAVMLVVSVVLIIDNLLDKQKSFDIYNQLQDEFFSSGFTFDSNMAFDPEEGAVKYLSTEQISSTLPTLGDMLNGIEPDEIPVVSGNKEYNEELVRMKAGLASLRQINEDLYGWISIENTTINYPVVQGDDNDYYLNHAYTGEFLPNGSIFADYRNYTSIARNYNTVMYGHNITSGAMFHDVEKFFKSEYFDNVYINVYTDEGIFIYEPFAVYETRYDYNYFRTSFKSAEEFVKYAYELLGNSAMKSKADMTFDGNDRILTMSTCTNGAYYARYALHAKLIKVIVE